MKNKILPLLVLLLGRLATPDNAMAQTTSPIIRLPFISINASVVNMGHAKGVPAFYWATVANVPSGYDVTNGSYFCWCVMPSVGISSGTSYSATLASSYVTNEISTDSLPRPTDLSTNGDGWNAINYLINHKTDYLSTASNVDMQYAMWFLLYGQYTGYTTNAGWIATNVLQNGGSNFVPSPGQKMAVIIDFDKPLTEIPLVQDLIIEVTVPTPPTPPPSNISGNVYADLNNNGVFDSGDIGLSGVLITLTGTNYQGQTVTLTTNTAANGSYSFTVPPGTYSVVEGATPGYLENTNTVGSLGGTVSGDSITTILVAANAAGTGYNFGELPPASISGFNYIDANNDGIFENIEEPIFNTTITLNGTNDQGVTIIQTTTTDSNGHYAFGGLRPGLYAVTETQNPNYNLLQGKNTCGQTNNVADGLVVPLADEISQIVLLPGSVGTNFNFGELPPGSISGFAYIDENNNGIFEGSETPLPKIEIQLTGTNYMGQPVSLSVITTNDGSYIFTNLSPSDLNGYTVTETPATAPASPLLVLGTNTPGNLGGTAGTNLISSIPLAPGATSITNNFGELPLPVIGNPIGQTVCSGSPAELSVTVSNHHGALTYQWRKSGANLSDGGDITGTSSNTLTFSSAFVSDAGSYDVVVSDAYGAVTSQTATLTVNPTPTLVLSKTDVQCHGGNDGSITATVGGSVGTISIDDGYFLPASSTQVFDNLTAGDHTVTTKSANDCVVSLIINVGQPDSLVTINSVSSTNVACHGFSSGSLTITASGGTGSLLYSIDGGQTFSASGVFNNLPAMDYHIIVKDANGCSADGGLLTIHQPATALMLTKVNVVDATCKGSATGGFTVQASGGAGSYIYSVNGGASSSTNTFNNLAAGNYQVVAQDQNGCIANLTVNVGEPDSLVTISSVSSTDVACKGSSSGTITVSADDGTGALAYSTNGSQFFSNSGVFNNVPAGTYHIVVKDANGCSADGGLVTIHEPATALTLNGISTTNVACKGSATGVITIDASGGTGNLSYSADNGTNFQASNIFTNLVATNYSIVVLDNNGCMVTTNATITEPDIELAISSEYSDVRCKGSASGNITINASGGVPPYQYSIDNGVSFAQNNVFSTLSAGQYQIAVKDASGCQVGATVQISEPDSALSISFVSSNNITCSGAANGSINVSVSGGQSPIHFLINGTYWDSTNFPITSPGNYIIVATNENGCTASLPPVTITQPAPLGLTLVSTNPSCNMSNGVVTATLSGGTPPYKVSINGGATNIASSPYSFSGLGVGNYTVLLLDANNCSSIGQSVTLKGTCPLVLSCPINAGQVGVAYLSSLVASGGALPYTFSIISGVLPSGLILDTNTGAITGTPLSAGAFSFTAAVTDSQGTTATASCSGCGANVTWDFSTPQGALEVSQGYTNSGVVITAYGYTNINTPLALYGKSAGATETGLGLVGTTDHEIGTNEYIQLDLGQLIAAQAQSPKLIINSVQCPEKYNIYGSTNPGTLGTLLVTNSTIGNTAFLIPKYPNYRYISIRSVVDDVLITSLSAVLPAAGCVITVAPAPVTLCLTGPCNTGRVGVCYSSALKVNGGTAPYSFVIVTNSLPPGLKLNSSNGSITGTPTTAGVFTFSAQVTDSLGNKVIGTFTITIGQAPLVLCCVSSTCGTVGSAYSGSIPASGGTPGYTFSISSGTLPPGLTLNPTNGIISGIPTTAGTFPITIKVTDSTAGTSLTATANCSIKISPQALSLGCVANKTAQMGVSYLSGFTASGGTAPYTYSISCGVLPCGLSLNPTTGAVTGTPTKAATYSFTAKVIDSTAGTHLVATVVCCIRVSPQPLTIGCLTTTTSQVGTCFSSAFVTSGGTPSLAFSITSGCLPSGLSLDTCTGLISGTPTAAGSYSFTVQVKDSTCSTATASCGITVSATPGGLQANPDATSIKLTWCPVKTTGTPTVTYTVARSTTSGGQYTVIKDGLTATSYTDTNITVGVTYYYVVSATVSGVVSPYSSQVSATVGSLPSPWKTTDVGCVGASGSGSYNNCVFKLGGSGADIWGCSDAFRYVYQQTSGDCTIVAKVASVQNTSPWAKAGLMIRESTAANSRHASVFITPGNGVAFQWRSCTGGGSCNVNLTCAQAPCWLKLVRSGNCLSAYYSTDASNPSWKQIGSAQTISIASCATFGLAVTSHNDGAVCTATFSNVCPNP